MPNLLNDTKDLKAVFELNINAMDQSGRDELENHPRHTDNL